MTRPNRTLWVYIWASLVACAAAPLSAADVQIAAVQFPDNKTVDLPLAANVRVAPAQAEAEVRYRNGQAEVEISYKKLPPALLFAGDVTSYVVWVVARDGTTENLGELIVRSQSGKGRVPHGPEGIRHAHHGRAVPAGLEALRSHHLHLHRSAAQEGQQHSGDALGLPAGAQAREPDDRQHGVLGQRIPRPHPGPERPAAGDRDGRREVRAGRHARRQHLALPGHELLPRRPEQAGRGLRPPERLPVLYRHPQTQQKEAEAAAAAAAAARAAQMESLEQQRTSAQQQAADAQAGRARLAGAGPGRARAGGRRPAAADAPSSRPSRAQQEAAAAQQRAAAAGLSAEAAEAARRDAESRRRARPCAQASRPRRGRASGGGRHPRVPEAGARDARGSVRGGARAAPRRAQRPEGRLTTRSPRSPRSLRRRAASSSTFPTSCSTRTRRRSSRTPRSPSASSPESSRSSRTSTCASRATPTRPAPTRSTSGCRGSGPSPSWTS